MRRRIFNRKPKDGQTVDLFGKTYQIKAYKGPILIRKFLKTPPVYYLDIWYVPGFLAAHMPYKYTPDMAIAPPSYEVFPTVPAYETIPENSGFTFAKSVTVTTWPAIAIGGLAILISLIGLLVGFLNGWAFIGIVLVTVAAVWFVHVIRLTDVHVGTTNSLRRFWNLWIWAQDEMVQSQDIDRVFSEIPAPKLYWSMFAVTNVTVQLSGTTANGTQSMVVARAANGNAVKAFLVALQESLERADKDSADATVLMLAELKTLTAMFDEHGRLNTASINDQVAFHKSQSEFNQNMLRLMSLLVNHFIPEEDILEEAGAPEPAPLTEEIPILPSGNNGGTNDS